MEDYVSRDSPGHYRPFLVDHHHDPNHDEWKALIESNMEWASHKLEANPGYFAELAECQNPPFLYIGCSDSRLPLTVYTKSGPGDFFVHRNIANIVSITDINFLSVLEYATKVLKVRHIVVAGHYNCGGIKAAVKGTNIGIIQNWVQPIRRLYLNNRQKLDLLPEEKRLNKVSELNVVQQVLNLLTTSVMMEVLDGNHPELVAPTVHGVVIDLKTGLLNELPLPLDLWKKQSLIPKTFTNNDYIVSDVFHH